MNLTFLHPLSEQELTRMLASEGLFYVKTETGIEVREIPACVLPDTNVVRIRKGKRA